MQESYAMTTHVKKSYNKQLRCHRKMTPTRHCMGEKLLKFDCPHRELRHRARPKSNGSWIWPKSFPPLKAVNKVIATSGKI